VVRNAILPRRKQVAIDTSGSFYGSGVLQFDHDIVDAGLDRGVSVVDDSHLSEQIRIGAKAHERQVSLN
jgi:hypothetical protein